MSHDRAEDEIAVNAMLGEMYQAWAANDADGFVRYYTDDATAILPGSLRGSRKAIRDSMAAGFDGPLKASSTLDTRLSLRFVGEDVAIAVSEGGILFAGEDAVPEARKIHATWVFEKRDGRWMVAAYHNSPVHAPVPA
ncbi:MAG TPA: SgcJ/EcaC family oxidoreductase [Cellulomonas sp.]|uniref:SgcJ/EcaC family oxidoreductase n=1 Tax=Cellulomonas sp. TaxID=40001 RepID=UPI002E375837|nr:SgcJ/EcaC family oxidoreductase [Cellulomonas sp.]HEX5332202.1 SgcJ/EcaC family oxidoreductase [Cellulomonas sp.]